jgi:streptogramin lyase
MDPYGIAAGPSDRVWYYERRSARVVLLDPGSGAGHEVRIPTAGATIRHIGVDEKRRRVWLPMSDSGKIGRMDWKR